MSYNQKKTLSVICLLIVISNISACHFKDRLVIKYYKTSLWIKTQLFISKQWVDEMMWSKNNYITIPTINLAKQDATHFPTLWNEIPTDSKTNPNYTFKNPPVKMSIAAMIPPFSEDIATFTKLYPLVRPVPYPYYSVFSVPGDACGSHMSDIYYSMVLFQRKYGLDFTSSFFTALDYLSDDNLLAIQPSFIDNKTITPFQHPVQVGDELIDTLPAFLTYYYRGWFDHIHSWASEGSAFISLIKPLTITGNPNGHSQNLTVTNPPYSRFDGLDIKFQIEGDVKSFILKLQDHKGQQHYVAVGAKLLPEQQGWEFPLPQANAVLHLYAPLATEQNKHPFNIFGLGILNFTYLQNANLTVYGPSNSSVTLTTLRAVPFDRNTVAKQMQLLQQYNIFPIVTTNHGGTTSWYQELQLEDDSLKIEYNNKKYDLITPPMGSTEGSPTYISDLFNRFGLLYRSHLSESKKLANTTQVLEQKHFNTEVPYYSFGRTSIDPDAKLLLTPHPAHAENLGAITAKLIMLTNDFAVNRILYTHFNYFNKESFSKLPATSDSAIYMATLKKLPPNTDKALTILTELKYNRSGAIKPHQRIWVPTISTNARYAAVFTQLPLHAAIVGNTVKIQSWLDPVSERQIPDPYNPTLDLNGQTFYVPNAASAIVELDGHPLTALKRNPKDFTGRESVTVVDLTHPKLFFDKLNPLDNHAAKIIDNSASLILSNVARIKERSDIFAESRYASADTSLRSSIRATDLKTILKIVSAKSGMASITIQPYMFDNYETDFLHFVLKKSRPDLHFFLGWKGNNQHLFVATDATLENNFSQWKLPTYSDTQFHDYVADYSDLTYAKEAPLPRGPITEMQIGMLNAEPGDFVIVDRIEFLATPGVKAEENGFVLGGRVLPAMNNIPVTLVYGNTKLQTQTERGGWYFFKKIPKDAIVEISANYKDKSYLPIRGRLLQAHRNDVEYHIRLH